MAAVLGGCGDGSGSTAPTADRYDVFTIGDGFVPAFLEIAAGDTVRWTFAGGSDGLGHDVVFDATRAGRPANIPVTKSGSVARVFDARGTFPYDCFVHPGMRGEVTVR